MFPSSRVHCPSQLPPVPSANAKIGLPRPGAAIGSVTLGKPSPPPSPLRNSPASSALPHHTWDMRVGDTVSKEPVKGVTS